MRFLLLDNYDSFTYNLVHYLEPYGEVDVVLNDQTLPANWLNYDALVLSPGPGLPYESGQLMQVIEMAWGKLPILGICLGHQALCSFAGAQLLNLSQVRHGVTVSITTEPDTVLFNNLETIQPVGLYHSWAVAAESLPEEFRTTAWSADGVLMAVEHQTLPIFGVQFHPESIMTTNGKTMVKNFVDQVAKNRQYPFSAPA